MSSCFLCDCSYNFQFNRDIYGVYYAEGKSEDHYIKQLPIMVGSTGTGVDDQQHKNNNKQNYVSYRVKKIEFIADFQPVYVPPKRYIPDYIILFKVPFRNPVFEYNFTLMKNFMLFSEPESVLKYGVYLYPLVESGVQDPLLFVQKRPYKRSLVVDKPFIVGPNDYVGVLYFFAMPSRIDASARVWFDIA